MPRHSAWIIKGKILYVTIPIHHDYVTISNRLEIMKRENVFVFDFYLIIISLSDTLIYLFLTYKVCQSWLSALFLIHIMRPLLNKARIFSQKLHSKLLFIIFNIFLLITFFLLLNYLFHSFYIYLPKSLYIY